MRRFFLILFLFPFTVHAQSVKYASATANESRLILNTKQDLRIMSIYEDLDSLILRCPSVDVNPKDTIWKFLAERMIDVAKSEGVGIAAPQVGVNRNIICVQRYDKQDDSPDGHPWEMYFNPQIVEYSDSIVRRNDGCLSVPTGDLYPEIEEFSYRYTWVRFTYFDADGIFREETVRQEYTAHIIQHEVDHLNAIMFFDRQKLEQATIPQ